LSSGPVLGSSQPYISGHNINFGSGNKYLSETDISLSGPGKALIFKRTYNSQDNETGVLGYGWSAPFSTHLEIKINKIILIQSSGRQVDYNDNGQGGWTNGNGKTNTITKKSNGYQLTKSNKTIYYFDLTGKLTEILTPNNLSQTFTYNGDLLASVTDTFGRSLTLTYNQNGRLETLTTPIGDFTYTYDTNDNLISVQKPDNTTKQYIYDDPNDIHNLTGIIDEENVRILTVTYDTRDRVISSSFADGAGEVQIDYLTGFHRSVTNSLGVTSNYLLESKDGVVRIKSYTGPGCSTCGGDSGMEYTYNNRLQVTQSTDGNGNITTYEYDENGNRTKKTEAVGTAQERSITWTYDAATNEIATTTTESVANPGQQKITTNTYDTNGNLLSRTETGFDGSAAISRTTTYTYDTYGRILTIDGYRTDVSDITTFTYYPNEENQGNNRGNLQSVTDALDRTTTYSQYNAFGKPGLIESPTDTISMTYDTMGRLLTKTREEITATYHYDATGLLTSVDLPDSRTVTYTYTATGKTEKIEDSLGNSITYTYDTEERRIKEEVRDPNDELKRFVDYEYEDAGQLDKTIMADGSTVDLNYDTVGNLVERINELGKSTSYSYDALNRLTAMTEPGSVVTGYNYDTQDNLTSVTDAKGNTTSYAYDDFGRRLTRTSPETGLTTYSYDTGSNLTSSTDANNVITNYEYDALNRLLAIHYLEDSSQDITYGYDQGDNGIGHLTSMQDPTGTTNYSYDVYGRLIQEDRNQSNQTFTTTYSYNNNSELISITYPSGRIITYNRNSAGQVTSVTSTFDGVTTTISDNINHLPFGPMTTMTLGNGLIINNSYDQLYRLTSSTAGALYNRDYSYFANSNVQTISNNLDQAATQNFIYDDLGRLLTAQGKYGSLSYSYDNVGNRQSLTFDSETTNYSYEPNSNRLAQSTGQQTTNYSYDSVGNLTNKNDTDYIWSKDNRLLSAKINSETVGEYGYDGRGLRTIRTANGETVLSVYDQAGNMILEADPDGKIMNEYVYLDGKRITLFNYQLDPEFHVEVTTSTDGPLAETTVYAFDENNNYSGINAQTDENGMAVFQRSDFDAGNYRFRVDYLGGKFWSEYENIRDADLIPITIEIEPVEMTVVLGGNPAAGVPVYVFDSEGNYLGITATTDSEGKVEFNLAEGVDYTFRTDMFGNEYWSETITVADGGSSGVIDTKGGTLALTLGESEDLPLAGVTTYLFSTAGTYLGYSSVTDSQGIASYLVSEGTYKIRIDYLGYQYWSEELHIVDGTSSELLIPHQDVTVTVSLVDNRYVVTGGSGKKASSDLKQTKKMAGNSASVEGITLTLYTPDGTELGATAVTDEQGTAVFHVPEQQYKVMADYRGNQYWTDTFIWQDSEIIIEAGTATITVVSSTDDSLADIPVSVYSSDGTALELTGNTDNQGEVMFLLPDGPYLFSADYQGNQYWSSTTEVIAHQDTPTTIDVGGGSFVLTVLTDSGDPLKKITTLLYSASGVYLNENAKTDNHGQVAYDLATGSYKILIQYLGHDFWTDVITSPEMESLEHVIQHQEVLIAATTDYNGDRQSLKNVKAYLYTADEIPLNIFEKIGKDYKAHFSLPAGDFKVGIEYMGGVFFSDVFNQSDTEVIIEEGIAEVSLLDGGSPVVGVEVFVFSKTGEDLGESDVTDQAGQVQFRLPEGTYSFRAEYNAVQYSATATVTAHQINPVTLNTGGSGGSTLTLTLMKNSSTVLSGVECRLFDASGQDLNQSTTSNDQGVVTFSVSDGNYQIRADYLGGEFWSDTLTVPGTVSDTLTIEHQDVTITVESDFGGTKEVLPGVSCTLVTADGTETGLTMDTNENGEALFSVPLVTYKVKAEYLGSEYWSEEFNWFDTTISIPSGEINAHVTYLGADATGAEVHLYSESGTSLDLSTTTDSSGEANFAVPVNGYKLKVDYDGSEYWTDVIHVIEHETNSVEVLLDKLALDLTNNPNPQRIDRKGPVYGIRVASLGSLVGLLSQAVTQAVPGTDARTYYYISDHLNTAQLLVDDQGEVVWQGEYKPFGGVDVVVNELGNNFRFPGQYYDAETGLHYNWHRFYDPETGRYISADPIGLDGGINLYAYVDSVGELSVQSNLYSYAGNNPVNFIDTMGLWVNPFTYWKDFGGGAGDFLKNYNDMRDANTIGADKYFHCMANCEASKRGSGGEDAAIGISEAREWFDENIKGDSQCYCDEDRAANAQGRNCPPEKSCKEQCKSLRPTGLDSRY